ncbi:MAG: hypothetical protein ABL867_05065 [Rickettsiales bacterium]
MEYLGVSINPSTAEKSIDIDDKTSAQKIAREQAKNFMDARERIRKASDGSIIISIKSGFTKNGEETISDALFQDYNKGNEQNMTFEFGRSLAVLSSNKGKHPSLEVEVTQENMNSIIRLMNQAAIKPRDSKDTNKVGEEILGDLKSGLAAYSEKSNLARM